jgi:hypothetical protein
VRVSSLCRDPCFRLDSDNAPELIRFTPEWLGGRDAGWAFGGNQVVPLN